VSVDECEQVRTFSAAQGNDSPAGEEAEIPLRPQKSKNIAEVFFRFLN